MVRNSQLKQKPRTGQRQYLSDDDGGSKPEIVKSNQRLSKQQILSFWAGSVLMLVASFIIGFKAGQKVGAKEVLDQAANQTVRLPIVRPIGRESETVSLAKLEPQNKKAIENLPEEEEDRKIDFTSQSTNIKTLSSSQNQENKSTSGSKKLPLPEKDDSLNDNQRYEFLDSANNKFLPTDNKKKKEEAQPKVEEALIDPNPIIKEPEKPTFNIDAYKPSPGWYIQVTAVPTIAEVESIHSKLCQKNITIKIESASIRNRPYYRILFGPYTDRGAALEKITSAKQQAAAPGEPFIRQVK